MGTTIVFYELKKIDVLGLFLETEVHSEQLSFVLFSITVTFVD